MALKLTINDVVARTGIRTARFSLPARELVDGVQVKESTVLEATRNRFMVLSLPKHVGQFIRLRPDLPADRYRVGQDARKWVGDLLKLSKEQLGERTFVFVEIQPPLGLDLFVEVNTDHPTLVKTVDEKDPRRGTNAGRAAQVPPVRVDMRIDVVVVDDRGDVSASQVNDIGLLLMPMQNMPEYGGYTALDFGNTSSTLVLSDTSQRDTFELVPADVLRPTAAESARPVQTALAISAITPPAQHGGFLQYDAVIGSRALDTMDTSWLVLGAKRLLSDRKAGTAGEEMVIIGDDPRRIPAEDPAEVFISEMLQGMFFHRQARPRSIAITCPTTFTASEVARLKRTVARGFHRVSDGNAARFQEGAVDAFVPLVIDEASAAAFYFAHRDFIAGPGRTPAFRYLYPNGLHMLLYDCGGGTTDLALVRVEARGGGDVEISVLGRAGHRHFGGDFITRQVFRLLKAKLAVVKRACKECPKSPAQIATFLEQNEAVIDRAVPTTYDRGQQQNHEARRRRQTTLDLWRLAESLKLRLSAKGAKEVRPEGMHEGTSELDLLTQVLDRIGLPEGMEPSDVAGQLPITRQEVDALVDPEIDRTIVYANDLVRDCMERLAAERERAVAEPPLEIPEVDRVYVVGNASRYPRICERLLDAEHGLRIRYLEERIAEVRPEDFKNSVAKGAIVAQRLRDMHAATRVSWDDQFMDKLPFDLVSETLAHAGDPVLFRRGEPYTKDLVAWREIAPDSRTGRPTTQRITLDRRWPGESAAEPCMIFQFDEPVAGRFVIRYDETVPGFVMHPDRKGGADEMLVVAEPFEQAAYLAPPQSGKI